MNKKEKDVLRCVVCGSLNTYFRKKEKVFVCQRCGQIWRRESVQTKKKIKK